MTSQIAIVEDEPLILEVVQLFLENQGYAVHCFSSADLARSTIQGNQIDLLICDVRLGQENGIHFTKTCEQAGFTGAVLIISGFIPNSHDFAAHWHFLRKPFSRQALLNEVEVLVQSKS